MTLHDLLAILLSGVADVSNGHIENVDWLSLLASLSPLVDFTEEVEDHLSGFSLSPLAVLSLVIGSNEASDLDELLLGQVFL